MKFAFQGAALFFTEAQLDGYAAVAGQLLAAYYALCDEGFFGGGADGREYGDGVDAITFDEVAQGVAGGFQERSRGRVGSS